MKEQRKAYKILIFSVIVFLAVLIVSLWIGFDFTNVLKDAFYKPEDLYGLEFKEWRYDTNGGSKKSLFHRSKHKLYPIYEYKNEEFKNEFFDFEIKDDVAYISNVKKYTNDYVIYFPDTIKINSKKYKVVGVKANSILEDEYDYKYKEYTVYGTNNLMYLDDYFASKVSLKMYNFPNLKNIGDGNYFINHFNMNNNLESVHIFNILKSSSYESSIVYLGDNCKLIGLTDFEKELFSDGLFNEKYLNDFNNLKISYLSLSSKNPYYTMKNNVLYSKDMKSLYWLGYQDLDVVIEENDLNIMPLAISSRNLFYSKITFTGRINNISTYAINTNCATINFDNEVNMIDDYIFTRNTVELTINFNFKINNYSSNSFENKGDSTNINFNR